MGGAERNARKKKQEQLAAAKAVTSARGGSDRNKVLIGIAAVVVLALVVVGGVIWSKSGSDEALSPPSGITSISVPIKRDNAVVVVGKDDAKATIDVYEDFICPACGSFEAAYKEQIKKEIEGGSLRVRYHPLPFLVKFSDPPGYSANAANAALCATDEGKFWEYHETLFAKQPKENSAGYTKDELVKLGTDLGITGETFKTCVQSGTYDSAAQSEMDAVRGKDFFQGTPAVVSGTQTLTWNDPDWLTNLVK
ncbi:DsbA family protein [Actinosynnema sp. NPDC020468]|uniref:DsbA family protein n=1 Tax=Actinosynnema sp. NPDC020468 TaxID=3154488 RepID=UPI0033FB0A0D